MVGQKNDIAYDFCWTAGGVRGCKLAGENVNKGMMGGQAYFGPMNF